MNIARILTVVTLAAALSSTSLPLLGQSDSSGKGASSDKATEKAVEKPLPPDSTTQGSVDVAGQHIAYTAIAGTLTVGATDVQDAQLGMDGKPQPGSQLAAAEFKEPKDSDSDRVYKDPKDADPVARIF